MASNDRLRRREEREGPEPRSEAPAPAPQPHVASMLALQRSAGNRALQRLMYGQAQKKLTVPESWADQRIRWDGKTLVKTGGTQPQLKDLFTNETFKGYVSGGMNLPDLETIAAHPDQTIKDNVPGLVTPADPAKDAAAEKTRVDTAVNTLKDLSTDRNRVVYRPRGVKPYATAADADVRWAIGDPQEFIPGVSDLGEEGQPLTDWTGEGPSTNTYYKMACVLIALLKYDAPGYTRARTLIGAPPTKFGDIVQKLSDYYIRQDVQYDDTSTRFTIMNYWGYDLMWAGESTWADLAKQSEFKTGQKYIFDIEGHTVKVRAKKDVKKDAARTMANPKGFFDADSDEDNYTPGDEFKKKVKYIWVKKS